MAIFQPDCGGKTVNIVRFMREPVTPQDGVLFESAGVNLTDPIT